ncbi:MAG: helix-turn-helix domain-containing protein [Lactobacillaceae bacterium]|jgi:transcriptional regulator with XRE-family HTH domain|nr:helix-turn-helix domain-containing protein [Lactobacillaceae bacterium]
MFPERLRQLRKGRNLTLPQLAEALNKAAGKNEAKNSGNQIGNWERGEREPNYHELIKLADFFDVSVDFLVGRIKQDTVDLLQVMFVNDIKYQNQTFTNVDKYNIMNLISNYFNKNDTSINQYFDNQGDLFDGQSF